MNPSLRTAVNPNCTVCGGSGYFLEQEEPCSSCDGEGSVLRLPAAREPARLYVAMTVDGPVDEGTRLDAFLCGLLEAWPDLAEDVAVFFCEESQWPRIVAILRPEPRGVSIVYV